MSNQIKQVCQRDVLQSAIILLRPSLYLLLNGVRRVLHPPFLQWGFVLGVHHRSEGHQLKLVILKEDFSAGLEAVYF